MKIVQRVDSCNDCPNRHYYSGGRYECMEVDRLLPSNSDAIPIWCPLPDDPTAKLCAEIDRLAAEVARLTATPTALTATHTKEPTE